MSLDEEELKEDVAEQSELVEPADVEIVPGLRRDGYYSGVLLSVLMSLLALASVYTGEYIGSVLGLVISAVILVSVTVAYNRDGINRRFWNGQGRMLGGEPA